jgi:uncharacterized protein YjiS (DUF1127 family)
MEVIMQMIDPSCAGMALTVTGSTAPALCAVAASVVEPSVTLVEPETTLLHHCLSWLWAVLGKLTAWYRRRREIARTRRLLASYDTRMLKDIGLSHADAEAEISKGFWRS